MMGSQQGAQAQSDLIMANIFITTTNKLERISNLDLMIVFCLAWDHLTMSAAPHICRILIISHNCVPSHATGTVDTCLQMSVMLTKFSAWLDLQPIRLVFFNLLICRSGAELLFANFNICHFIIYLGLLGWLSFLSSLSVHLRHSKRRMKSQQSAPGKLKLKIFVFIGRFCLLKPCVTIAVLIIKWICVFLSPCCLTIDAQC